MRSVFSARSRAVLEPALGPVAARQAPAARDFPLVDWLSVFVHTWILSFGSQRFLRVSRSSYDFSD
jgi:hypothetical protein